MFSVAIVRPYLGWSSTSISLTSSEMTNVVSMQTQTCLESDVAISKNEVLYVEPFHHCFAVSVLDAIDIVNLVKVRDHAYVSECLA